jgi:glyoxylase-like metal-dependent hydrolase (beta-lactamase superfamily II)
MTQPETLKRFVSNTGVRVYRIPCDVLGELVGDVYLLLGAGPPTLVDAGGEGDSLRQILEGIEAVGTQFGEAVRIQDIRRILITHAHIDHIGGLRELVDRTGAEVAVHTLDRRVIEAWDERSVVCNTALDAFLHQAGVEPAKRPELIDAFGYRLGRMRPVQVDRELEDGQELDGLRIIHTPGHSPGHICILAGDVLLTGDHILLRTVSQQWPERVSPYTGLGHYLDSLEKIRRIGGIQLALGGHERGMRSLYHRIDEIRTSHHRRLDRLLDILRKSPHPLTIYEANRQMYSRQTGFFALLAVMDVGARIEYLDQRGRLTVANLDEIREQASPIYRYRPGA